MFSKIIICARHTALGGINCQNRIYSCATKVESFIEYHYLTGLEHDNDKL